MDELFDESECKTRLQVWKVRFKRRRMNLLKCLRLMETVKE